MNKDLVVARLEAVAAIAKVTALDVANNRLWEGELDQRLSNIHEQLKLIPRERP